MGDLQLRVYAAPSYLERAGTPSHPRELEDTHQRIVGFLWSRIGKPFPYAMRRNGESIKVQGRYVLSVDDGNGNAYLAADLAGMGGLWLPDHMSKAHSARGKPASKRVSDFVRFVAAPEWKKCAHRSELL